MTIVTKDVKTLVEIKSLDGQEGRSLVMFDASTGEPLALDMEILIDLMKRDGSNANVASLAFNTALPLEDCPVGAIRWNSEKGVMEYRITTDSYIPLGFLRGSSDVYMPVVVDGNIPIWDDATRRFVAFDLSTYITNTTQALSNKQDVSNLSNDIIADAASTTKYPSVKEAKDYADSLVVGLLDYRGGYDASSNVFPSTGGSGSAGAVLKGDMWVISVAGTLGGKAIHAGDSIIAKIDNPAQAAANWNTVESNLSYVPEDVANKSTDISADGSSDTKYPSTKASKTYADTKVSKTGNESISGIKTFSSSPIVPTPTTDSQAATKAYVDAGIVNVEKIKQTTGTSVTDVMSQKASTDLLTNVVDADAVIPAISFVKRGLADSATQIDKDLMLKAYANYYSNLAATRLLFIPQVMCKERTSGENKYLNKMYNLVGTNDAVQAAEATQAFVGGYIAPNEKRSWKSVQRQMQTGLVSFNPVSYLATDSWTLTTRVKANKKPLGRLMLGSSYVVLRAGTIEINNGTTSLLVGTYNFECGRTYTIDFKYSNGAGVILVDRLPIATTAASAAITFGQVLHNLTYPFDGSLYALHLMNGVKSAYQSELDYKLLSTVFPDIEGVNIGNQHWATSNFESVVAGDGTVIPEVTGATTDGNPELITQPLDFTAAVWNKSSSVVSVSANSFDTNASGGAYLNSVFKTGLVYRVRLKGEAATSVRIRSSQSAIIYYTLPAGAFDSDLYVRAADGSLFIEGVGTSNVYVESLSVKEVGRADATIVYNSVYAATTGTAYQKEVAALKAAAMWAYPNDDPAMGAVYGKLFNGYATRLFAMFPPVKGWHVPSQAEMTQLIDYLGGTSVAGGKMKAKFGSFNNEFSNNESGFSAVSGGYTNSSGIYSTNSFVLTCYPKTTAYRILDNGSVAIAFISSADVVSGNLRLVRDEAAGEDRVTLRDTSTADITSTAKTITIPNGYKVTDIRLKTVNALTSIAVNLYDYANTTLLGNVLTKAAQSANTEINYTAATIDEPIAYTNRTLRVTAAGNTGGQIDISITLEKTIKND